MQTRWTKYLLLVGGWLVVGGLLSFEIYFNARAEMKMGWIDFVDLAIPQFGRAVMWGVLAPWILDLRRRMPLYRGRWAGGVSFHLGMSLVVMGVFYVGRYISYSVFFLGFTDFGKNLTDGFYGRNIIDIVYYWAVIAFGQSWEIYGRYKSEELKAAQLTTQLVETELKALREQLQPHFLFNTLNTISVLVRERKNDEAVQLIARLSSLLRMTLDSSRKPQVTLRQELEVLDRYVEIQKTRFSDRLTVETNIEPVALDARIPNLLLQPIVENAILHGVAPKPGPGHVMIRGYVRQERLHLEVSDDGPGLDAARGRAKEGIGLTNTRERVAKLYGPASHLTLRSRKGEGVTVEIVIPFRP